MDFFNRKILDRSGYHMHHEKKKLTLEIIGKNFLKTLLVLTIATGIALLLVEASAISDNIFGVYILAVIIVSRITSGFFWGILSSIAGVIGVNYFFTFPYHALDFTRSGYPITFLIMLIVSLITSAMTLQILDQARIAQEKENQTSLLYEVNRHLLSANGTDGIIQIALNHLYTFFACSVVFFPQSCDYEKSGIFKNLTEEDYRLFLSDQEQFTVRLVFQHKKKAGNGANISTKSCGIYIPVISHDKMLGVFGLLQHQNDFWNEENLTFLDTLVSQIALAMERQLLSDSQHHIVVETEKEKMRSNLLRAVSHDLRTPLTCIHGSSSTLLENKDFLDSATSEKLIRDIYEDSQWLIHMVENLLAVTRISGDTTVRKVSEAVEEILAEAVSRVKIRYPKNEISVQVPEELLLVPMDATLIEQVIINLTENAIKHSKLDAPVEVTVKASSTVAIFQVSDNGIGLKEENIPRLFDGYSSNQNTSSDSSRGMGIGLSICKSIINAHGGDIKAFNKSTGGAVFEFTLPMEGEKIYDQQN